LGRCPGGKVCIHWFVIYNHNSLTEIRFIRLFGFKRSIKIRFCRWLTSSEMSMSCELTRCSNRSRVNFRFAAFCRSRITPRQKYVSSLYNPSYGNPQVTPACDLTTNFIIDSCRMYYSMVSMILNCNALRWNSLTRTCTSIHPTTEKQCTYNTSVIESEETQYRRWWKMYRWKLCCYLVEATAAAPFCIYRRITKSCIQPYCMYILV